jgi:hypothetical protein
VATPVTTTAAASATRLRRSSSSLPIIAARTCPAPPAPRRPPEARPRSPGRTRSACALPLRPRASWGFLFSSPSLLLPLGSGWCGPSDMDLPSLWRGISCCRWTDMMGPAKLIRQQDATVQQLRMLLTKSWSAFYTKLVEEPFYLKNKVYLGIVT